MAPYAQGRPPPRPRSQIDGIVRSPEEADNLRAEPLIVLYDQYAQAVLNSVRPPSGR